MRAKKLPSVKAEFKMLYFILSGSNSQKAVQACTIRLLNFGSTKHEEAVIYAVNQWITNVLELRKLFYSGAIRGNDMRGKIPFAPHIISYMYCNIKLNVVLQNTNKYKYCIYVSL